ncbi:MAG: hypothetical protein OEN52_04700, partial [Gammaproteobacteria bacterium]|nr:hypothetical protein [Gammaproteobacteria bacterium]
MESSHTGQGTHGSGWLFSEFAPASCLLHSRLIFPWYSRHLGNCEYQFQEILTRLLVIVLHPESPS